MNKRHVIIGGGITGLAAAYFLEKTFENEIVLLEASHRLGGKIGTIKEDGFIVEAGPDSFVTVKPGAVDLIRKIGLESQLIAPSISQFYVFLNGKLCTLPEGFVSLVPTKLLPFLQSDLFTVRGKLRLALEPLIPARKGTEDESIDSFFARRMGREVMERIAGPLFAGIYASTPSELSLLSTFPQFRDLEVKFGSVTRGILAQRKASKNGEASLFGSLKPGMEALVDGIISNLSKTKIFKGKKASLITQQRSSLHYNVHLEDGEHVEATSVLLTVPAFAAALLLKGIDEPTARLMQEIPYVSTCVVTLAFKKSDIAHPMNATGFVISRNENCRMISCTWSSSKWEGRSPNNCVLVRCFFGKLGDEDIVSYDDDALVRLACEELNGILGISGEPIKQWVYRWNKAMPQYLVGHMDKVRRIESGLKNFPGLFVLGSAYRGVGLPDCIKQARDVVDQIKRTSVTEKQL